MKSWHVALLLIVPVGCARDKSPVPPPQVSESVSQTPYSEPLARQETKFVEVSAKVRAVDPKKRTLTLQYANGVVEKLSVDESVTRLNEIKKGDIVVARYAQSIALEVRAPTAEEKKTPSKVVQLGGKADSSSAPALGAAQALKAIVTIEGIDRAAETVTVRGPQGNFFTVKAHDPKNLDRIRVGDTVAVTYAEAVIIGVEAVKRQ